MICHQNSGEDRPMVAITKPLVAASTVQSKLLVCPNGPGTCAGWMARIDFEGGMMLACTIDSKSVRGPTAGPMRDSPYLNLGIKIKVPCANLKAAPSRNQRRPW
jgi:hypothetical protein